MRNTSLRRVGGGRRGLSLNHLAGALHCRKIPDTPSCNARRWKERLRSICDAPYLCEEGKKPKKQREAEPDTRSSSDPIKKLLRYWRLNVSDVLIPPPPPSSRRVPIFFLCTVCVLCISLANRRRGFSSVSFHPSFSLSFSLSLSVSFAFCVTKIGSRQAVFVPLSWWTSVGGMAIVRMCFLWGKVSGDEIAKVRQRCYDWRIVLLGILLSPSYFCKGEGVSICFLSLSKSIRIVSLFSFDRSFQFSSKKGKGGCKINI